MIITGTPGISFDKVEMDKVDPLPITKTGHEYILTMQDQLSKFSIAVPLIDMLASTIADALIKRLIYILGLLRLILTDQGKNF